MSGVFICTGGESVWRRKVTYCPTCKRRRRMVSRFQVWYGDDLTCLGCGDSWQDGERCPRPWRRGWRKDAIAYAKEQWAAAPPAPEARKQLRRLITEALS